MKERRTPIALGGLLILVLAVAIYKSKQTPVPEPQSQPVAAPASAQPAKPAKIPVDAAAPKEGGGAETSVEGVLPLPDDAPKGVTFGVILVSHRQAQGARPGARTKAEARKKAVEIVAAAKKDFKTAVKLGDPGSTSNAGHIPRGVLEPAAEYALFTLAKKDVNDEPIDTPRGYWIVRRVK